jgi:cysteinyl-tRNA synthetase
MLQVEGKKMSKSLGNFFTVRDLLDQGVPGEVIRFVMLSTHYRKPMDWTEKKRAEAEATLRKWYRQAGEAIDNEEPHEGVVAAIADDLNTAGAIAELHQLSHANDQPSLRASMQFVGLMGSSVPEWAVGPDLSAQADHLFELWQQARDTKDFSKVDELKAQLLAAGIEVRLSKAGAELDAGPNFDPAKLEALK